MNPSIEVAGGAALPQAVIIVAHGGQTASRARAHRGRITYLWQWLFSRSLLGVAKQCQAQVWRLRYRYRGWNADAKDAAHDAAWAVAQAAARHPGAPVILIGHSMGGRAVLFAADAPNVRAVCALAPWIEPGDPYAQLAGTAVLIVHGDSDRVTDPGRPQQLARRVGGRFVLVNGGGHAMLSRPRQWRELVTQFVREQLPEAS